MAQIKSLDKIASKFVTVTPQRSRQQYREGVSAPRRSWSGATAAAEGNYEQGVQAAITRKSFGKGVRAAGDSKQMTNAAGKGATRFGPGVAEAGPAYNAGFAPYHAAIGSVTLPPRFARRDPRNLARVSADRHETRPGQRSVEQIMERALTILALGTVLVWFVCLLKQHRK